MLLGYNAWLSRQRIADLVQIIDTISERVHSARDNVAREGAHIYLNGHRIKLRHPEFSNMVDPPQQTD